MPEVIFNDEQLQEKLKEWQKRLRLQDWIIEARICRIHELMPDSLANIHPTLEKKAALIKIMDPIDYDPTFMLPYDMENSLVHELLHLHLWPITGDDEERKHHIAEEQAIECITSGLLSALRFK
ncbi:hypothetical protein M3172_08815 [Mesobacillus subterraneus]|uniref:hypothetical protein n=1 Tax=Mesobacillus subterraneus TaxID=285983 RepID=UPI00203ABAD0|nr:hypothetical protein [Mesobacillus subterraneus]MCM3573295.1 hypothetical protein [Mesobacillus subterraneus]